MNGSKDGILDILEKSKGYKVALLTTFNFEIGFFEKAVLSRLLRNDIRKVSVFVDAKELSKGLVDALPGTIGQRYAVNPVFMQKSFHPKVILLLGDKKARLIIESANLTLSGFCINNEIFDYIDFDEEQQEFRDLILGALLFFERCNLFTPQLDNALLQSLRKLPYIRRTISNNHIWFLESTQNPILGQVLDIITEPIEEIYISVPYYDNALSALQSIHESFPDASISLFVQHEKSTFPENVSVEYISNLIVYDKVLNSGKENGHFYHGKVFLFRGNDSSYILYGSSNCTMSALTKAKSNGGNVEANLFAKGTRDEYDEFFKQYIIAEGKKPDGQIMSYTSEMKKNFFFKFGLAERKLVLHFGYHQKYEPIFILNNKILDWKYVENDIIVETDTANIDSIFDILIRYEECEETVRCWYINREILDLNRISVTEENTLKDAEDFGIGEKFLPDYERLLREMDSCKADYLYTKEMITPFLNTNGIQEDDLEVEDELEGEEFIVNVELNDEDYAAYKEYRLVERIRNRLISRYFNSASLYFKPSSRITQLNETIVDPSETLPKKRRATTEEKRFERFVKRCVRGMLDEEFSEMVEIDQYFGLIIVVFDIFTKYNREEKVEGIFPDVYIIATRCALLTLFLEKPIHEWEYRENAVEKIIDLILDNHEIISHFDSIEQRGAYEQMNRKLLLLLNEKFSIRNTFDKYVIKNRDSVVTVEKQERVKSGISYIDELFGYKTLEQIQNLVRKNIGKASALTLSKDEKDVYIYVFTDTPGKNLKPDITIIRELVKYSIRVKKLYRVFFIFKKQHPKPSDSIIKVRHEIKLDRRQWSYTTESGDGRTRQYPSSYLIW